MAGRPMVQIDLDVIQQGLDAGLTKIEIANTLNISRPTLNKILNDEFPDTGYSSVTDDEIDSILLEAKLQLPNMGERLIIGYFKSKGFVSWHLINNCIYIYCMFVFPSFCYMLGSYVN